MLKIAEAHGYDLTAEDFQPSKMEELTEDEMMAVAGGSFCHCYKGGVGNAHNLQCFCPDNGEGLDTDPTGSGRCHCFSSLNGGGVGWN